MNTKVVKSGRPLPASYLHWATFLVERAPHSRLTPPTFRVRIPNFGFVSCDGFPRGELGLTPRPSTRHVSTKVESGSSSVAF